MSVQNHDDDDNNSVVSPLVSICNFADLPMPKTKIYQHNFRHLNIREFQEIEME